MNASDLRNTGTRPHVTQWIARFLLIAFGVGAPCSYAQSGNPAATHAWVATGDMKIARSGHTATLLKDGKVLAAGGVTSVRCDNFANCYGYASVALDSAELYDPSNGTWRQIASMNAPKQGHTASLLGNGQVLVVGGDDAATPTAELYDPPTDRWFTVQGPSTPARDGFLAVPLRTGKVLVAGGGYYYGSSFGYNYDYNFQNLGNAEIYEPARYNFRSVAPMHERTDATATVISDGKVMVSGGFYITGFEQCCGDFGYSLSSVDIFDPATETWRSAANLREPRSGHAGALLPDGKVLIVGGVEEGDYRAEIYDPNMGASLPAANAGSGYDITYVVSAIALPGGEVLVMGGKGGNGTPFTQMTQIYNPADGRWRTIGNPTNATSTTTRLADGRVLASGGLPNTGDGVSAKAELLVPTVPVIGNVVEYYHAALDHYFITASQAEIDALDSGQPSGWTRTGYTFSVWLARDPPAPANLQDVCRIRIPPDKGDSHFFSASEGECAASLGNNPGLTLETASAFLAPLPDAVTGNCPPSQSPVYRLWNNRSDSNHRYTTSRELRDEMLTRGYVAEGYGPDAVAFCADGQVNSP